MEDCILKCVNRCRNPDEKLCQAGPDRIKSLINASLIYKDDLHHSLEAQAQNKTVTTVYHKSCVSTYVSKHHLKKFLKDGETKHTEFTDPPAKMTRRSISETVFNFKKHYLFCGQKDGVE